MIIILIYACQICLYLYDALEEPLMILHWRHNERDSVSNHHHHDCLLNRLFRRRSKKTSQLRVTGLCEGNSPGTGEFPAQMASNAENVSIWWRHHETGFPSTYWIFSDNYPEWYETIILAQAHSRLWKQLQCVKISWQTSCVVDKNRTLVPTTQINV